MCIYSKPTVEGLIFNLGFSFTLSVTLPIPYFSTFIIDFLNYISIPFFFLNSLVVHLCCIDVIPQP